MWIISAQFAAGGDGVYSVQMEGGAAARRFGYRLWMTGAFRGVEIGSNGPKGWRVSRRYGFPLVFSE